MSAKAIIFDFAGVVGSESYWDWLAANFRLTRGLKAYFTKISHQVDDASISEGEFLQALSMRSNKPAAQVKEEILSGVKLDGEVLKLVASLRTEYKVGLLTNYCKEWMRYLISANSLEEYFDSILISSELGVVKPNPRIYNEAASRLGVRTAECVFIDDRQSNIDGAAKLGMTGILFTSFGELHDDLKQLKIV